jgi:GTPase SAR1 family protein/DNA-directed RNA polymerase subunit RPC12/RpoP
MKPSQSLSGHPGRTDRLCWSPDGRKLASAGRGVIWIRDSADRRGYVLDPRGSSPFEIAMAVRGQVVVSGSGAWLKFWDIASGSLLGVAPGFESMCVQAPTGEWVLTRERSTGAFCLLIPSRSGEYVVDRRISAMPFGQAHGATAISPDGNTAYVGASGGRVASLPLTATSAAAWLRSDAGADAAADAWTSLSVTPDGRYLVGANLDHRIYVFDLAASRLSRILEGHTAPVVGVDSSPTGELFVTKGFQERIMLWRTSDWECVEHFAERAPTAAFGAAPRFNPTDPELLVSFGDESSDLRIWKLDLRALLGAARSSGSRRLVTARVGLLGDPGVGKSGLGHRIAAGVFRDTSPTHGQQFWVTTALAGERADGAACQVVLWDFAGQPDYRLVHALFLHDLDVGLLLFDASREDSLRGVEYWHAHLRAASQHAARILVAARTDVARPGRNTASIRAFCAARGIDGQYVETSARRGDGILELASKVKAAVPWDRLPITTTDVLFQAVRAAVFDLKQDARRRPFVTWETLSTFVPPAVTRVELEASVANLQKHGYVMVIRPAEGASLVLLAPDLLINLCASLVLEARDNVDGSGALEEARLMRGQYAVPELNDLDASDRSTLLDAALTLFLDRALCRREQLGDETLLVFPTLIDAVETAEGPTAPLVDDTTYRLRGPVQNVYPGLVILLGYTRLFGTSQLSRNEAWYTSDGYACGVRLVRQRPGAIDLVLSYQVDTPPYLRRLFQGLSEKFLARSDIDISVIPPARCGSCGRLQNREASVARIDDGRNYIACEECGRRVALLQFDAAQSGGSFAPSERAAIGREDTRSHRRVKFEAWLVRLKRRLEASDIKPPSCFISYAWGDDARARWIEQLAADLSNFGVVVTLDRWHSMAISTNVARFISGLDDSDFVLVIGTPDYLWKRDAEKADETSRGYIVAAEIDLIESRLSRGNERRKASVLPLLLSGRADDAFPALLRGRTYADFRDPDHYFETLAEVVLTLFGLANAEDGRAMRSMMSELMSET